MTADPLRDALTALADEWDRAMLGSLRISTQAAATRLYALLAAHPAPEDGETVEALEACREQRGDLLALLEVEREQHAEALVRAWHEGYGAGSSDATDGWLHPGSPRRECPYPTPAPVADQQPTEGEKCRDCGPGYRIGSEGCRHTAPTSGTEGLTESDTPTADMSHNPPIADTETGR